MARPVSVPCPVGGTYLQYQFLNTATPIPLIEDTHQTAWLESGTSEGLPAGVGDTLCNNLTNEPCGPLKVLTQVWLLSCPAGSGRQRI